MRGEQRVIHRYIFKLIYFNRASFLLLVRWLNYLRLAADDEENENALQRIQHIGRVPEVVFFVSPVQHSGDPRDDVRYPSDSHHNHQLQAHMPQRGSANTEKETED